jgi:hypothetical protein
VNGPSNAMPVPDSQTPSGGFPWDRPVVHGRGNRAIVD